MTATLSPVRVDPRPSVDIEPPVGAPPTLTGDELPPRDNYFAGCTIDRYVSTTPYTPDQIAAMVAPAGAPSSVDIVRTIALGGLAA